MKTHKNILLIVILPTVIMGLLFVSLIRIVPRTAATDGTLTVLSRRIRRYVKLNDEIPHNLSNLPILKGFGNDTEDGWGNDIIYVVNGTEVTLTSLGRDGKIGGEGEDADIIEKFDAFKNLDDPFCSVIFPQFMTYDTMSYIAARIETFVNNNSHLPDDILNLPEMKISKSEHSFESSEYYNRIIDHWGEDIIYKKISPIKFQLLSYGEDLKEGGIAEYSDMERTFELNGKGECVEIRFNLRDE